ncbi:MAG: hypothetical protein ACJ8NR_18905 [Sulfurifustis sp.]
MRKTLLAAVLVAAAGSANADDITVVGGFDFGFKKLHLDTGGGSNIFNPGFNTINPSVALGYKSFYAILSYDTSISAEPGISDAGSVSADVLDFSRTDSTVTLGYRINDSFNLFAGYTKVANHFTETRLVTDFMGNFFFTVTLIDYTEAGPFAGVAYTKRFADKGSLSLSLGYAKLDGTLKFEVHPSGSTDEVTGDTTGLSYGLTWSGTLTGSLGYRVGIKGTQYKMKASDSDITERYTNLFIGITNYF